MEHLIVGDLRHGPVELFGERTHIFQQLASARSEPLFGNHLIDHLWRQLTRWVEDDDAVMGVADPHPSMVDQDRGAVRAGQIVGSPRDLPQGGGPHRHGHCPDEGAIRPMDRGEVGDRRFQSIRRPVQIDVRDDWHACKRFTDMPETRQVQADQGVVRGGVHPAIEIQDLDGPHIGIAGQGDPEDAIDDRPQWFAVIW